MAQPLFGPAQRERQLPQVAAAQIAPLDALEIVPDALVRVQLGGVAWQLLQVHASGTAPTQEVLDGLAAMNGRPVPDHQELATDLAQQHAQEADDQGAPEDLRPPLAGPHLAAEAVRSRPAVHEGGQLGELLGAQARLPTGCGMAPQPLHALLAPPLEPLADGTGRHAEGGGDVLLFPALLFQLPGTLSPPLAPIELRNFGFHGAKISSFYASTQRSVKGVQEG